MLSLVQLLGAAILLGGSGLVWALAVRPLPAAADGRDGAATVALAAALGGGLVPLVGFFLGYGLLGMRVGWATTALAAALVTGAALAFWRWRRRRLAGATLLPRDVRGALRRQVVPLAAAAAVGAVYLVAYDRSVFALTESCINRSALHALGVLENQGHLVLQNVEGARLGSPAVLSGWLGLLGGPGFRALYAYLGALLALGGYLSGRAIGGGRAWGLVGAALLALSPAVLKIPLLDENLITLGFAGILFPWLLRERAPWVTLGLLAALAIGVRHILVLAVPAMLVAVWFRTRRPTAVATFLGALAVATVPYHVHHVMAFNSLFAFESFGEMPPMRHDFGFGEVAWRGLLNWPFHRLEGVGALRTPGNPYPLFVQWPLWFADHFGLVLLAAAAIGFRVGWRRDRAAAVARLGWFLPVYLALAVQENWDYDNKMNVALVLFPPALDWTLAGLRSVVRRPRLAGPALAVVALAAWGGVRLLAAVDAPADPRYVMMFPGDAREPAGFVAAERERVGAVAPWPDYGRLADFRPGFGAAALVDVGHDFAAPALARVVSPLGWHLAEPPPPGEPVTIALDLARPPWGRPDVVALTDGAPDVDLTADEHVRLVGPIAVPWHDEPLTAFVTPRGDPVAGALFVLGDYPDYGSVALHEPDYLDALMYGDGGYIRLGRPVVPARLATPGPVLRLRVPAGAFNLFLAINTRANRYLFWKVHVTPTGVEVRGPLRAYHS